MKIRVPFWYLPVILVPAFLAQSDAEFIYGTSGVANTPRVERDTLLIDQKFEEENLLVLLVPKESVGREAELCGAVSKIPNITNVVSYATAVGTEIPPEFVPESTLSQFYSENYARIIIYTNTEEEGEAAFNTVREIMDTASAYYDAHYLAGQSATYIYEKCGLGGQRRNQSDSNSRHIHGAASHVPLAVPLVAVGVYNRDGDMD